MIDEARNISMVGSIDNKRLCSTSRPREIQMIVDVVKVAATILVVPEYVHVE